MILITLLISAFSKICLWVASRTSSIFLFSGNTLNLSRPTTDRPDTARLLDESPSVRMSMQSTEFLVPTSLASSSFGMPFSLECFLDEHFWPSCFSALNVTYDIMDSTTPNLSIYLTTWSET